MTDLYLCVPDDSDYYMYCDNAYKYNEKDSAERDSGFDLYCKDTTSFAPDETKFLKFGITSACAFKKDNPRAYWLMARSSISKTNFMLHNSMGLIDSGYRGPLMAAVTKFRGADIDTVDAGTRLVQLVSGSAKPWNRIHVVRSVDEFPKPSSLRGSGGFGSTGT